MEQVKNSDPNVSKSLERLDAILQRIKNCEQQFKAKSVNLVGGHGDNKKERKYKELAKILYQSVSYFKGLAEHYYKTHAMTSAYYGGVANKLMELKSKMAGMDTQLSTMKMQYNNNSDKIQMMETFITALEKLTKNPTQIDLQLKSKLDDKVIEYDTRALVNEIPVSSGYKVVQLGGSDQSTLDVWAGKLEEQFKAMQITKNSISLLDKKLADLTSRMEAAIQTEENIFKFRAQVEWIVNRLEECKDGQCSQEVFTQTGITFDKLEDIVNKIQDFAIDNGQVREHITKLEKYVSMLESSLNASKKTIGDMDGTVGKSKVEKIKTEVGETKQLGGKQKGGFTAFVFEDTIPKEIEAKEHKFPEDDTDYFASLSVPKMERLDLGKTDEETGNFVPLNIGITTSKPEELGKYTAQDYGKLVMTIKMTEKCGNLFQILKLFNDKIIIVFKDINHFEKTWNQTFQCKNANTDYYSKMLGDRYEILFGDVIKTPMDSIGDIIKTEGKTTPNRFDYATLIDNNQHLGQQLSKSLIPLTERTYSFAMCLLYVFLRYSSFDGTMFDPPLPEIDDLIKYANIVQKNISKSALVEFAPFETKYENIMVGGNYIDDTLNNIRSMLENMTNPRTMTIDNDKLKQIDTFYPSFVMSANNTENNNAEELKKSFIKIFAKTVDSLDDQMNKLRVGLTNILNKKDETLNTEVMKFNKLSDMITKVNNIELSLATQANQTTNSTNPAAQNNSVQTNDADNSNVQTNDADNSNVQTNDTNDTNDMNGGYKKQHGGNLRTLKLNDDLLLFKKRGSNR